MFHSITKELPNRTRLVTQGRCYENPSVAKDFPHKRQPTRTKKISKERDEDSTCQIIDLLSGVFVLRICFSPQEAELMTLYRFSLSLHLPPPPICGPAFPHFASPFVKEENRTDLQLCPSELETHTRLRWRLTAD